MRNETANVASLREWTNGWLLVLAAAVGFGVATIHVYCLGVLIGPLERDLGWSRSELSSGLTIVSVLSVLAAPFVGSLIDKWGSRRVALPGMLIYCAGIASLSAIGKSIGTWLAAWCVIAIGVIFLKATVWTAAVATRFVRSRGLAFAFTLCGTSICAGVAPMGANRLIELFGWREGLIALAAIGAGVAFPLLFFFFRDAADIRIDKTRSRPDRSVISGLSIGEGFRSAAFVRLALAALFVGTAFSALIVSFVPILISSELRPARAAQIAGLVGAGSIGGRIISGILLDKINPIRVGAVAFLVPILAVLLLYFMGASPPIAAVSAGILGLTFGSEIDVLAYLSTKYFGLRNYGILFGTIVGVLSFSLGLGSLISGLVFDWARSYGPLLLGVIPAFLLGSVCIGTLGVPSQLRPAAEGEAGAP